MESVLGMSQEWNMQKLGDHHTEQWGRSRGLSRASTTSTSGGKTISEPEYTGSSFSPLTWSHGHTEFVSMKMRVFLPGLGFFLFVES